MYETILLVSLTYEEDALGQQIPVESRREIFCRIKSASSAEWFDAGRAGLVASYTAIVPLYDYQGEDTAIYEGDKYGVYRTYKLDNGYIELHLGRKVGA